MELTTVVNKLWEEKGIELLICYDKQNQTIFKTLFFSNLLRLLNLKLNNEELYYHPVTILGCILCNDGIFKNDVIRSKYKIELGVDKINLNKYQKVITNNGKLITTLILPEIVTPETIKNIKYNNIKIRRPPQLKRILKRYFTLLGLEYSFYKLEHTLIELEINNIEYSYLDADEIILYNTKFEADRINNYIDLIPTEIKNIITLYIDQEEYFNLQDLLVEDSKSLNGIVNKISNTITNKINSGEDVSIIDLLKDMNIKDQFIDLKESIGINTFQDMFNKVQDEYGIGNIIADIQRKVS